MSFSQEGLVKALQSRSLLCQDIQQAHQEAISTINKQPITGWKIALGDNLIFDLVGLKSIKTAIQSYRGSSDQLLFKLQLSPEAIRDYYSHNCFLGDDGLIKLPVTATRIATKTTTRENTGKPEKKDTYLITLDELTTPINYPRALTSSDKNSTPLALLMPYSCDHDLLFANQIAIFSALKYKIRQSPLSWLRATLSRRKVSLNQRISLIWKQVHPSASIHPSAVIEGSVIGAGCRIGAHCVVRYSVLGNNIQLHDGAKVEYSVIGDNSWLMHDLVAYRCLLESDIFLIHGPYQFSYFQNESAAFANIMMDYRPDNKPIRINTPNGVVEYKGRFLGALLEEQAKVFGGTLTVPGITIPTGKEVSCNISSVTTPKDLI